MPSRPTDPAPRPGPFDLSADDPGLIRGELRRQITRFCPARLRNNLEDIVQAAWIRLESSRKKNEGNPSLGASLIARVAFCATMDECRRLRRRREISLEDGGIERTAQASDDPAAAAQGLEIRRALEECLTSIAENRSLAVTLHLLGHSVGEAARLLGWTASRTENLVYRGLADLRRCLAAKGITP